MRSSLAKWLAAALVSAAVFVPGAAATSSYPAMSLPLLPLPKAALGPAASALHISLGSGWRPKVRKVGRGWGYELSYGNFYLARAGLDYVQTSVDQYKTARAAKHALPYWKKQYLQSLPDLTQLNLTASEATLSIPAIGARRWATIQTFTLPNYGSLYYVNVEFSDGNYVLDVAVGAGSKALATKFAKSSARKLDKRLHLALTGRLHAHPVALPKPPHQGPPANGPDPATMVLQTSDLGTAQIKQQGYDYVPAALSTYDLSFQPAGSTWGYAFQTVSLMPSTNSAAFVAAFTGAADVSAEVSSAGPYYAQVTPVDISAVGDEAQGAIVTISGNGQTLSYGVVSLHSGDVADVVYADVYGTVAASDVQTLAQAAADRLDAALGP